MNKIATAECFTHGKIGRELHAIAQGYTGNFGRNYIKNLEKYGNFDYSELSVICSLFIPTIEAVKTVLQVENPPEPTTLIKGIKCYEEKEDKEVSEIMAKAVKKITSCDIAIGTTAGIGRGGITIISNKHTIITTTDITSDLRKNNSEELFKRQENGIEKCIEIILFLLNNDFNSIKSMNNIEIIEN